MDSIELEKVDAIMREVHERLCALVPEYWPLGVRSEQEAVEPLSAVGRPNRFVLFSDGELEALAEMTSSRTTSADLSLHRRRVSGQVHAEIQRRAETS